MKLFEVPRNTWVKIVEDNARVPPCAPKLKKEEVVLFDHIDGMYSLCYDKDGEVVHLAAWTDVEIAAVVESADTTGLSPVA